MPRRVDQLKVERSQVTVFPDILKDVNKHESLSDLYNHFENEWLVRSEDARRCSLCVVGDA